MKMIRNACENNTGINGEWNRVMELRRYDGLEMEEDDGAG